MARPVEPKRLAAQHAKDRRDLLILALLDEGLSVRDAARVAGVTKSTVVALKRDADEP